MMYTIHRMTAYIDRYIINCTKLIYYTGDECPMGAYCPEGSDSPTLCSSGTYLNSTRNTNITACIQWTAGHYCSGAGNAYPTGSIIKYKSQCASLCVQRVCACGCHNPSIDVFTWVCPQTVASVVRLKRKCSWTSPSIYTQHLAELSNQKSAGYETTQWDSEPHILESNRRRQHQ